MNIEDISPAEVYEAALNETPIGSNIILSTLSRAMRAKDYFGHITEDYSSMTYQRHTQGFRTIRFLLVKVTRKDGGDATEISPDVSCAVRDAGFGEHIVTHIKDYSASFHTFEIRMPLGGRMPEHQVWRSVDIPLR